MVPPTGFEFARLSAGHFTSASRYPIDDVSLHLRWMVPLVGGRTRRAHSLARPQLLTSDTVPPQMASPALASRGALLGGVRGNTTILSRGRKVPTPLRSSNGRNHGCVVRVSAEAAAVAEAGGGGGKRVVFVGGTGRVGSSSAAALLKSDPSVHIILAAGTFTPSRVHCFIPPAGDATGY